MTDCFWSTGCADAKRCAYAGICIARWQHKNKEKMFANTISHQTLEIERLTAIETAARDLEPYLDQLICYGSTTSEHKPNLLVKNMKKALDNE